MILLTRGEPDAVNDQVQPLYYSSHPQQQMDFALRSPGAAQGPVHVSNRTLKPHTVPVRLYTRLSAICKSEKASAQLQLQFLWTKVKFPAFQLSLLSQIPNSAWCFWILSIFAHSVASQKYPLQSQHSSHLVAAVSAPPGHPVPRCQQRAGEQWPSWEPAQSPRSFLRSAISLSLSSNWTSALQLYGPETPSSLLILTVPIEVTNSSIPYFCTAEDEMEF